VARYTGKASCTVHALHNRLRLPFHHLFSASCFPLIKFCVGDKSRGNFSSYFWEGTLSGIFDHKPSSEGQSSESLGLESMKNNPRMTEEIQIIQGYQSWKLK
jgi:hypothetical protein